MFEKHIVFKNNIKIKGYIEDNKDGKKTLNDEKNKYDSLSDIDKDLYNKGFFELDDFNIKNKDNNILRSKRRSKQKVYDMCVLNDWDYFITLTFSKDKVKDRYDLEELKKVTLLYFKRLSKNHGIKYLLIPELHKDGALHWHGLIRDCNSKVKIEKANSKSKTDRDIYNIVSWQDNKGYNTAVRIDKDEESRLKISSYISKYISKADKIFKSYYYCSQNLKKEPKVIYNKELDIDFFLDEDKIYENEFCYIKTVNKEREEK